MRRNDENREAATAIDAALIEEWALAYLGRYASSADNLRRVLRRRVRRRLGGGDRDTAIAASDASIDALVARYRGAALLDDEAYAAARARRDLARGRSLRRIAAGLTAKGVGPEDAAAAIAILRDGNGDPELDAACAFARRRRLGPYRSARTGGDRQRELAAFARAGFDRQTAEAVLACVDEAAMAELLAGSRQ
jgi:regulatory protein